MNRQILGVGPRVAVLLKDVYPRNTAKLVASELRVSLSTAERWLSGHAPTVPHLEEMYGRWGERFVRAVFCEAFAANDGRLQDLQDVQSYATVVVPARNNSGSAAAFGNGMTGLLFADIFDGLFGRTKKTTTIVQPLDAVTRRMGLIVRLLETVPSPPE